MKLKKISLIFSVMMIMSILVGCASSSNVSQIESKGKIIMGTSADYPPFEFRIQNGGSEEIVGMDIAIANEIAKDLGVELEIKDMKFDELLNDLEADNVDFVIAGMGATEERKQSIVFSNVYYIDEQDILVKSEDMDKYKTLEDLKDAKIGVQKGSLQENIAINQLPDAELTSHPKVADLVSELKESTIDAIILERPVAESFAANTEGIVVCDMDFNESVTSGYSIAIKKGNSELVEKVNGTIDRLKEAGLLNEFFIEATNLYDQ